MSDVPKECITPLTEEACEWKYDGGDSSVGINPGWVCEACGAVDIESPPPTFDDDVI